MDRAPISTKRRPNGRKDVDIVSLRQCEQLGQHSVVETDALFVQREIRFIELRIGRERQIVGIMVAYR